ncbi:D-amino-acid transaminase [Tabrizicola sp.]|uniref:D-amino-acid transaminase n=1 Tax=Tabrizicola sp. TaxID=2005166 RepID=UPI002610030D|nr:D-amino-acid transaminase [Tabrizicola sp.]MDM7931517.1 D-amino-acid transaminase [Tabrizicola sp.]
MTRIVHVNGETLPEAKARISIFDRGFLMADAVYEVTSVLERKLVDFSGHLTRLRRSLDALEIPDPHDDATWLALHREMVVLNNLGEGLIYLQVTRGAPGDRDFVWPDPARCPPSVVLFTQSKPQLADNPDARRGWSVIALDDIRWGRRDIKTVQLLSSSWAKMIARRAGADDAWLVQDGFVTEGTSNNAHILRGDRIITRPLSNEILHGITRAALLRLASDARIKIEERPFTLSEAKAADEAFVTSASSFVMPVVSIDGILIGNGSPGPISVGLREIYIDEMRKSAL